ncbi:MAG: hypothetical protein LBL04_10305 [Bacteroidales bacterium]|nr:hypothetical protein [Bacteroidales bacterium]
MKNYVYGDWTAENTSARLASGLDELSFVDEIRNEKGEYATAQTTGSGAGRLIQMVDSGNEYNNAIQLQHESYRDGTRGSDQVGETVQAVIAHTVMADRMRSAKAGYANTANLAKDLAAWDKAVSSGDMSGFALNAMSNYDSSGDYWRRVVREDGTYGVIRDENHSLLDEDGNILVRSPLDIFDGDGNITGHKMATDESYKYSFGVLMGLASPMKDGLSDDEYKALVNGLNANLGTSITGAMGHTAADGSIDVNAFLMTYADVSRGVGVRRIPYYGGYMTAVNIKNELGEIAGTLTPTFHLGAREGEVDYIMVENMIPESHRLKAATFQIDSSGNVQMFGLGSTMPDPSKMDAALPAIADGTYRQVTSLHNLDGDSYKALRLFDAVAGKNATWENVTGPKLNGEDKAAVPGFPYTEKDNWRNNRTNLPGYYYDEAGNQMSAKVSDINAHKSNNFPLVRSDAGFLGGSAGCMLWYPTAYDQILGTQQFKTFGNFTINRYLFGDGTGGRNNYQNW